MEICQWNILKHLSAFPHLIARTDGADRSLNFRFADYRAHHSQARLDEVVENLLSQI